MRPGMPRDRSCLVNTETAGGNKTVHVEAGARGASGEFKSAICMLSAQNFPVLPISVLIISDMSDEIANNVYLVGIFVRDLHTGKVVFHQYHQLQTTEPVDSEIVTKVRFIHNSFGINTQILANKGAYFVGILTFLFQARLSCAQAGESHSDLLIRC
jgi:hypothetical protein